MTSRFIYSQANYSVSLLFFRLNNIPLICTRSRVIAKRPVSVHLKERTMIVLNHSQLPSFSLEENSGIILFTKMISLHDLRPSPSSAAILPGILPPTSFLRVPNPRVYLKARCIEQKTQWKRLPCWASAPGSDERGDVFCIPVPARNGGLCLGVRRRWRRGPGCPAGAASQAPVGVLSGRNGHR